MTHKPVTKSIIIIFRQYLDSPRMLVSLQPTMTWQPRRNQGERDVWSTFPFHQPLNQSIPSYERNMFASELILQIEHFFCNYFHNHAHGCVLVIAFVDPFILWFRRHFLTFTGNMRIEKESYIHSYIHSSILAYTHSSLHVCMHTIAFACIHSLLVLTVVAFVRMYWRRARNSTKYATWS